MNETLRQFLIVTVAVFMLSGSFSFVHVENSSQYSKSNSVAVTASTSASSLVTIGFLETGLLPGTQWSVSITNTTQNPATAHGISLSSYSSTIYFNTGPGTYNAQFSASGPYLMSTTYSFSVAVKSYTMIVPFTDLYNVQVTGKGLPANVSLGISLSGGFRQNYLNSYYQNGYTSMGNQTSRYAINGTYRVMVGETLSNGANLFGDVGNITVNNSAVNLVVDFHKLVLNETGLPENTSWGFAGQAMLLPNGSYFPPDRLYPGMNRSVTIYVPTGSTYLQPVAKGYYAPGLYANLTSGNASMEVHFQKEYPVTFVSNVQIMPMGNEWQINGVPYTFDGSPAKPSYGNALTFYLPNGTYHPTVSLPYFMSVEQINGVQYSMNYTYNFSQSNITVNGQAITVNVTFNITKTLIVTSQDWALYFTGAIIVGGSVFSAAMLYRERKKK